MTSYERCFDCPPLWWLIPAVLMGGTVIFFFGYVIFKGISTAARNAQSPLLEREATVVGRRQEVWGSESAHTSYYVTFQLPTGDREEFQLKGEEYGLLVEGDRGMLHSQGTAYKGFNRIPT